MRMLGGFAASGERSVMSNHLTPDELSEVFDVERSEVIDVCIREAIPILHGRVDKTPFAAHLQASALQEAS